MLSKKLGETKGPLFVWLFVTLCFAMPILFGSSSRGQLPQDVTISLILSLLLNIITIPWGLVIFFLVAFLAFWEKKRSLREIFSSVGLKRQGSVSSVFWTLTLTPFFLVIYLLLMVMSYFLGPLSFPQASSPTNGPVPIWYPYYMIIYSFFPVAVIEEAVARGYILDRLMPEHPSSIAKALPAIIISSLLSTLYHIPAYLGLYTFSLPWAVALLAGNVFPWSIALSVAYVRARSRNILGPVLIHFLADSMPIILSLA